MAEHAREHADIVSLQGYEVGTEREVDEGKHDDTLIEHLLGCDVAERQDIEGSLCAQHPDIMNRGGDIDAHGIGVGEDRGGTVGSDVYLHGETVIARREDLTGDAELGVVDFAPEEVGYLLTESVARAEQGCEQQSDEGSVSETRRMWNHIVLHISGIGCPSLSSLPDNCSICFLTALAAFILLCTILNAMKSMAEYAA